MSESGCHANPPSIEHLFERVLALESSKRSAFLAEACGEDAALRARVHHLTFLTNDILLVGDHSDRPGDGGFVLAWHVCRSPQVISEAQPE